MGSNYSSRGGPLTFSLVHVLPAVGATEDVFDLLALHKLALKVALVEHHLVGTCTAFEAVGVCEMLFV